MRRMAFMSLVMALFALAAFGQVAWAQGGPFEIACEGTESGGGGATAYQYTVKNVAVTPELLFDLYVGTQDINPNNYTFVATPPFTVAITPNGSPFTAVTDFIKTAHGIVPPGPWGNCRALVHWNATGGVLLPPGGTVTFGFSHPGCSQDVEWRTLSAPGGFTIPSKTLPIAGPLVTFTQGYVHGPNPVMPATTNWGLVVLVGLLAAVPAWLMFRRRRSVAGAA